jgi:glutamate-ammonia-ligase adenylyltransferase
MWSLKRTHLFPDLAEGNIGGIERKRELNREALDSNPELRRLARSFGYHADELVEAFDATRREVRNLHQDIYYRPMLPINAQLEEDEISLSPEAAMVRFASIGFQDPQSAMRHVQVLTSGLSRAAKINKILLPAVLNGSVKGRIPTWDCSAGERSRSVSAPATTTSDSFETRLRRHSGCVIFWPIRAF